MTEMIELLRGRCARCGVDNVKVTRRKGRGAQLCRRCWRFVDEEWKLSELGQLKLQDVG